MSNGDNVTSLIMQAFRNRLAELQTCMPAQVVSYNFKKQMAVVQPTINRRYADGQIAKFPVINNVPVIFPRSGGASLTFPVRKGDTVLLVFASRSIDTWLNKGGIVNQDDNRMHSINDAIAIPGLMSFNLTSKAKNNTDVLLTYKGAEVEILENGQINLHSPVKVHIDTPEVYMTGDLVVKNDIYDRDRIYGSSNDHRIKYNTHLHDEESTPPLPQYLWD